MEVSFMKNQLILMLIVSISSIKAMEKDTSCPPASSLGNQGSVSFADQGSSIPGLDKTVLTQYLAQREKDFNLQDNLDLKQKDCILQIKSIMKQNRMTQNTAPLNPEITVALLRQYLALIKTLPLFNEKIDGDKAADQKNYFGHLIQELYRNLSEVDKADARGAKQALTDALGAADNNIERFVSGVEKHIEGYPCTTDEYANLRKLNLIQAVVHYDRQDKHKLKCYMVHAINGLDIDTVRQIFNCGFKSDMPILSVSMLRRDGISEMHDILPLHYACERVITENHSDWPTYIQLVNTLLGQQENIEQLDGSGRTALTHAFAIQNASLIKYLLAAGAKSTWEDINKNNYLHVFLANLSFQISNLQVQPGVVVYEQRLVEIIRPFLEMLPITDLVNCQNSMGNTPLGIAVTLCNKPIIAELCEKYQADVTVPLKLTLDQGESYKLSEFARKVRAIDVANYLEEKEFERVRPLFDDIA